MSQIQQTITSDIGDVEKKLAKLQAEFLKLRDAQKKTVEESKRGAKDSADAFDGMGSKLAGVAGTYLSVQSAIALVTREYQNMTQAQERARKATMSVAEAQRDALINLGANSPQERDKFVKDIEQMSARTGVSMKDLYLRASTAMSARGNLSVDQAMSAVETSARFLPGNTEAGTTMAGSSLDLMKIMKGRGVEITPEQAMGYLMAIGQTARVVDPEKLARNLAPSLASGMASGASERGSGALWSALTGSMVDPFGEKARTVMDKLPRQLAEFLPESTTYDERPGQPRTVKRKGTGMKTMEERIEALRKNPKLLAQFMASEEIEPAAKTHVEQILSGKGAAAQAYDEFYRTLPELKDSGAMYQNWLGVMEGSGLQQSAQFERTLDAGLERLQTSDPRAARMGMIRDKYSKILQDTGMGSTMSDLESLAVEASPDAERQFIQDLESRQKYLQGKKTSLSIGAGGQPYGAETSTREASPAELKQAEVLGELVTALKELRADRERATKATEDLNANLKGNTASAAAANAKTNGRE
jgi:hypothetical protein